MYEYLALIVFLTVPGYVVLFKKLLKSIYVWQIKEYRFDRIRSFLKEEFKFSPLQKLLLLIKTVALLASAAFYFYPEQQLLLLPLPALFLVYLWEAEQFFFGVKRKRFTRPKLKSIRNLIILTISLFVIIVPQALYIDWLTDLNLPKDITTMSPGESVVNGEKVGKFSELLPKLENELLIIPLPTVTTWYTLGSIVLLEALSPLGVSLLVLLTSPLSEYSRKRTIMAAMKKIYAKPELKIVGITGSYGKTTTKELLAQILAVKYKVAKTIGHKNTAVGIAQSVLSEIDAKTEIFIAEMGAYRKGEILDATKVATPDIAIVTAVELQHLSLFGSVENIFEAKYELVSGLKEDGVAILNGDNEYCLRMAERTDHRTIIYYTIDGDQGVATPEIHQAKSSMNADKFPTDQNIYAKAVDAKLDTLKFTLVVAGTEYKIETNLRGSYNASNLLACIAASLELGVEAEELVKIINEVDFSIPYLNIYQGINDSTILDDGYNLSKTSFLSGLAELDKYNQREQRVVITQGILELGDKREEAYIEISEKIVQTVNRVITTDEMLAEVLKAQPQVQVILVKEPHDIVAAYNKHVKSEDIVLIEGSLPDLVLKSIKEDEN